jgi:hypothetical protein
VDCEREELCGDGKGGGEFRDVFRALKKLKKITETGTRYV